MSVSEALVREVKPIIERGEREFLEEVLGAYLESAVYSSMIAWDYVLLKVYIHACLKKQSDIASWTVEQTARLDPIQQIAIRHMLPYGRWLLAR